jgi:BA14K-like protein
MRPRMIAAVTAFAFASALPTPGNEVGTNDCASRFRSYDPATGTYLGFDGLRHPCS